MQHLDEHTTTATVPRLSASQLRAAGAACIFSDPGPDPTWEPEPYPEDPEEVDAGDVNGHRPG